MKKKTELKTIFQAKHDHLEILKTREGLLSVEIASREEIERLLKEQVMARTAVISIADYNDDYVLLCQKPQYLLQLKFDDVGENEEFCINDEHAEQIAEFLYKVLVGKYEIQTLICQCEHGESRSAAISAAIIEFLYGDAIRIFTDERYYPNKFAYKKVLQVLCKHSDKIMNTEIENRDSVK